MMIKTFIHRIFSCFLGKPYHGVLNVKLLLFIAFQICCLFNSEGQTEMFIVGGTKKLYSMNVETCTTQTLCSTQHIFYDIALNPVDGNLYGIDENGYLSIIDTVNCSETVIGFIQTGMVGLTFSSTGELYATSTFSGEIFEIDVSAGSVISLGNFVSWAGSKGDLTFYKGELYFSTHAPIGTGIIKVDLNNLTATDLGFSLTLSGYGLATLGEYCDQFIYGSYGNEVKRLNLNDLSSTTVCNLPGNDAANGMAQKITLPPQDFDCSVNLEMPNVFTPNGDNVNDSFTPVVANRIESMETTILNRWGNVVYQTKDININWNGESLNGKQLTNGTFYYLIRYRGADGADYETHGFFHLIRSQE